MRKRSESFYSKSADVLTSIVHKYYYTLRLKMIMMKLYQKENAPKFQPY